MTAAATENRGFRWTGQWLSGRQMRSQWTPVNGLGGSNPALRLCGLTALHVDRVGAARKLPSFGAEGHSGDPARLRWQRYEGFAGQAPATSSSPGGRARDTRSRPHRKVGRARGWWWSRWSCPWLTTIGPHHWSPSPGSEPLPPK